MKIMGMRMKSRMYHRIRTYHKTLTLGKITIENQIQTTTLTCIPLGPSTPDDYIGYVQLINRAAEYHGEELHKEPLEEDFLFETLTHSQRSTHTLPMLKSMLKHTDEVFKDPVRGRILTPG